MNYHQSLHRAVLLMWLAMPAVVCPLQAEEPFDYFTNNWNVVGLKDYKFGSRITPDNKLVLAAKTPVEIRIGADRIPLSRKHPKLAMHGWMPIILVSAEEGPVRYEVAYWATPLPDVKDWEKAFDWPTEGENFLNWIKVKAVNTTDQPVEAHVEVAPKTDAKAPRTPEEQRGAQVDQVHTRRHAWSWQLPPGGSAEGVARYPFFPVDDPKKYDEEDPRLWLSRTAEYWQGVADRAAHIEVPCRKASEALLAAHVCQLIAGDHGEVHGGEDFYDIFYPRDGAYQVMELEEAGLTEAAAKAVEYYLKCQDEEGRFRGGGNQGKQLDANGQSVWTLWQYGKITGDRAFLQRVYPRMLRAVRWTMKARRATPAPFTGVLHAAPADGECLWAGKHHIVGYDLWNLRGMLCTADAARTLGKTDDATELLAEAAAYRKDIDAMWKKTGLSYFPPSWEKDGTHWGNTETLWPTELFARDDPRVAALSRHVREEFAGGYIEGTIQWKGRGNVEAIHPYMGAYTTMTDLIRGRHEQVVEDFYWYLLHSTAAHAFPEGIYYKKRMAWSHTIPHVTGACNYAIMLRHMLLHEAGDQLHLLSAVPDWWLGQGEEIRVQRAPTHFGVMGFTVRGTAAGVELAFDRPRRQPPKRIVLHLPKSRPLLGTPPEGVEVVVRSEQETRWDFPTVVKLYTDQAGALLKPIPGLVPLPLGRELAASQCRMLDLTPLANTDPFRAPFGVENPGQYLFTGLPTGVQTAAGVPFEIIDPSDNEGRGLVVLHSPRAPVHRTWPKQVEIPVGRQGKRLFFLGNVHGWDSQDAGTGPWGAVAEYVIHYADGQSQIVPLITGRTADEWARPPEAEETAVGFRGQPWHLSVLGVELRPVEVEKIVFRDLGTPAAPVLAAVTLELGP